MGRLMRAQDWSATQLGAISDWPQSLKTAVQIILGSRYPMFIWWGRDLINLYNDGYLPMLGKRHPAALGQPASVIWSEIWDIVGPQTEAVLHEGRATWNEERLLLLERNGYPEEAYFTFSYSPIRGDRDGIGGIFCASPKIRSRSSARGGCGHCGNCRPRRQRQGPSNKLARCPLPFSRTTPPICLLRRSTSSMTTLGPLDWREAQGLPKDLWRLRKLSI